MYHYLDVHYKVMYLYLDTNLKYLITALHVFSYTYLICVAYYIVSPQMTTDYTCVLQYQIL